MREKPVWINGVRRRSMTRAAAALSASLGRKIYASLITERLKAGGGRFVIEGVEVTDHPVAIEEAENPSAERPAEKRRPLLKRRALDFGLSKPGWFA